MSALDIIRMALFGNPPTPGYKPSREGVMNAFSQMQTSVETLAAGVIANQVSVYYAARSSLYANLTPADRSLGIVYNDGANNGIYIKTGASASGSWSPTGLLGVGPIGPNGKSFYQTALDIGYIPAGTTEPQFINAVIGTIITAATTARDKSQDWAEGAGTPGGAGTRSSKAWAGLSASSASASDASAALALQYRNMTANTAATAQASFLTLGQLYQTISSGLAATADNGYFAVAGTGDVFATVYQKVAGSAVLVNMLASQSALDHIGRFVPNILAVDNSPAINAALNQTLVSGVYLPIGNIDVRAAIIIPTGKFVEGAGEGVTRLIGSSDIAVVPTIGKGLILANGANGVRVRNLTVVAPKSTGTTGDKVQGVWMRNTKDFLVENVEALNCGYSFWAHEFSKFGQFRNVRSLNANVHFEATRATDITFRDMQWGDGDNDNPLGVEAVYHALFESKRITFMDGQGTGKGTIYLVVADSVSSDGLVDDIRFIRCHGVNNDGKNALMVSKIDSGASVGRVLLQDCDYTAPGLAMLAEQGQITIKGGNVVCKSQQVFTLNTGTSLTAIDVNVTCDSPDGATGNVYDASNGPVRVVGGSITLTKSIVSPGIGANLYISPTTKITGPTKLIYTPAGVGQVVKYVYKADMPCGSGDAIIGEGTAEPALRFEVINGFRYRVRVRGKMKSTGSTLMRLFVEPALGNVFTTAYGFTKIEKADGTFAINNAGVGIRFAQTTDVVNNDIRQFEMDISFLSVGNEWQTLFGNNGVSVLAGAEVIIERIA